MGLDAEGRLAAWVSIVPASAPSRKTFANPQISQGRPIQLTPVPWNEKVALAPEAAANMPRPPLRVAPALASPISDQAPEGENVAALSSNLVVSDGGAFDTVTVTAAEVVRLPAASRAVAVN